MWIAGRRDSTLFGVVDDTITMKFTGRTCSVHCNSLPVVVGVLKFPIKDLDHWTSSSSSLVKPSQTMEFYIDIVYFLILFLAARVVMEREDETRSRGFGFVTFYEERDAQKAIDDLDGGVKTSFYNDGNKFLNKLAKFQYPHANFPD